MDRDPSSEGRGQGGGQAHRAQVSEGSGQVQAVWMECAVVLGPRGGAYTVGIQSESSGGEGREVKTSGCRCEVEA